MGLEGTNRGGTEVAEGARRRAGVVGVNREWTRILENREGEFFGES